MSEREHKPGKVSDPKAVVPEPEQQSARPGGASDNSLLQWRLSHGRAGIGPHARMQDERRALGDNLAQRFFRKPARATTAPAAARVEIPKSGGTPLAGEVRSKMEGQLGADLSGVSVHTGGDSARAADGLGARAFTDGSRVHFAPGEYAPGTKEGDRLIGHELTHVVQGQRSGIARKADEKQPGGDHQAEGAQHEVSQPGEPAEQEADATGDRIADNLHGDKQKAGGAHDGVDKGDAGKPREEAPAAIAAKLQPGALLLAHKGPAAAPQPAPPAAAAGAGAGPSKVDLATACKSDPIAKQKYVDVMGETQPRAAAMKSKFIADATKALESMPTQPLQAMRNVIRGGGYFFLGSEIPQKAVADAHGVSRVVDLPSIYKFYLDPSYRQRFETPEEFCSDAAQGNFNPVKHIDDRKSMLGTGGVKETWWFPSSEANAVDLDGLREQLYIKDNPSYEKGAVRCDMDPDEVQKIGMKLYKPTAFDGMMQGWGNDPWWVTKPGTWGITKNDTHEAVAKSKQWRFYKNRNLIKPTVAGAAPGAGAKKPAKTPPGAGKPR